MLSFDHPGISPAGYAFDLIMRARYCYYVEYTPLRSDRSYDELERLAFSRWPWMEELTGVGSEREETYPDYIREGRRPNREERADRDKVLGRAALGELW